MEDELKIDAEDFFTDDSAQIACEDAFKIKYMFPWQRLVVANIMDAVEFFEKKRLEGENNVSDDEKRSPDDEKCSVDDEKRSVDDEKRLLDDEKVFAHQIVLLPTGAGKSLCFQVPALLINGVTLIIYPLLALMTDQERRMNEGALKCVVFRGGQTKDERVENFRKLREENYKIVIANPEVLDNDRLIEELRTCNLKHIVIDEAHTVSEWGNTFRKSYLKLGEIIKKLEVPVVTAFTATASPEVLQNVNQILFDGDAHIVRSESDRPNIHYYVYKAPSKKQAALFLSITEERPMIIFCGTRHHAEDMSREINTAFPGGNAKFYHAGLEKEEKKAVEKWFFERKDAVLCATCAFGMGIDKSDIRTVIHLDAPETVESYIQEAGRGGRDRNVANAILLWNYEDEKRTKNYEKGSRKAAVRDFAINKECRRQSLLDSLGAEKAYCSGCDICDRKKREEEKRIKRKNRFSNFFNVSAQRKNLSGANCFSRKKTVLMPGEKLPDSSEVLLDIIKKYDKSLGREELEEKYLKLMNHHSLNNLGIKIWNHESFENSLNQLFYENKIKVLKFPWKSKFSVK